ncbi:hypothetical protein AVEN_88180-1, partial [Araneus ventricosus]
KDELIAIAEEMGLTVPDKAKVVDLKALIESSDVYRDDIELVRNLIDTILEEKREKSERDRRECELELEKIRLDQFQKQLEIANATRDLANTSRATEIVEPGSLTDNLESLIKSVKTLTIPVPVRMIHFPRENSSNPASHLKLDAPAFVPKQSEETAEANSQSQFVATGVEKGKPKNVLLSTIRELVKNKFSQWVEVRCLLDVGSQSCLCTRACAERLQLRIEKVNTVFSCVNDASMIVKNCVKTSVANRDKNFEREFLMLVVNKITDFIPNKVINVDVDVSEFVSLADHSFNVPDKIDMLLGAEIFYELLRPGQIYAQNSQLLLQNTVFGYVVSGSVDQVAEDRVHCGLILDDDLNKTLKQFWEIESVDVECTGNTEASLCEDHFVRTHKRNKDGRYVVSMALSRDPPCLGNSKDRAVRQLNSLWKRLSRDSEYLSLYTDFLREYEDLGHLERVVESSEPPTQYYIPHHGVLRPDKLTTKLRVVFNASSPTTTGISLNGILMKGDVIEDVFQTISRFRRHKFAFTTDIQKMYRQILIDPDQQDLQRIVWKTGPNSEVSA